MDRNKIQRRHLERLAFVYLRQSTIKQARFNLEGKERQSRMQEHVEELGWPSTQIRLLDGDTGNSGSSLHGRDDYQSMVEAVVVQTAGLIAARELSRLVRDNQDWNHLVRLCRYKDVLLCDEYRVYDPADPQDRVMLGIQGAFNEFELAMITDRMQESARQKAARGELAQPLPPGYVYRHRSLCEKHPDERVQRAVRQVFHEFASCVSVYGLYQRLLSSGFQMPVVAPGADWRDVKWIKPTYKQVLDILKNPAYAGIYVHGRSKTVTDLDEQGHAVKKREVDLPREAWAVFLEQHHEAYIDKQTWEENVKKIEGNARRSGATWHAPAKGVSLLVGLLRCARCGNRLHVHYTRGASGVRYLCRRGVRQRAVPLGMCFGFAGDAVDHRIGELVLQVVRPGAIESARLAAEQMAADHQRRRQLLVDRLEACRETESRAAREYKTTDETYTVVRRRLAEEWDERLQAVHVEELRLREFDDQQPSAPTPEQSEALQRLSADLEGLWFDPQTDMALKKQIVRTLIEEIVVDLEPTGHELMLWIHWSGGHHTQVRLPTPARHRRSHAERAKPIIETLRKVLSDAAIASVLNREGIRTWCEKTWTRVRVRAFRCTHHIPGFSPTEKSKEGWLTQAEAATRLGISPMSVSRLVQSRILPAEQPGEGLPSVLREQDLTLPVVERAVRHIKATNNGPLPADPNQLSLFPTTDDQ